MTLNYKPAVLPLLPHLGRQGAAYHFEFIGRNTGDSMIVLECPMLQERNFSALCRTPVLRRIAVVQRPLPLSLLALWDAIQNFQ